MVPHSLTGLHLAMTRKVASKSFRPRRDAGWMRGSRLSILKSKRRTPQTRRRATITVRSNPLFCWAFSEFPLRSFATRAWRLSCGAKGGKVRFFLPSDCAPSLFSIPLAVPSFPRQPRSVGRSPGSIRGLGIFVEFAIFLDRILAFDSTEESCSLDRVATAKRSQIP